jgi:hypothetical protein
METAIVSILKFAIFAFILARAFSSGFKHNVLGFGGGDEQQAPTAKETSAEAIQAQLNALPQIVSAQRQFGPELTQIQLDSLNRFGPQFAQASIALEKQFGPQLAEATLASQNVLDPSRSAGSQAIAKYLQGGPDQLTPEEEAKFRGDVRAAQSTRGLAESGFGAQDEFAQLTGLRQQLKSRYLETALSASGRLPTGGRASVNNASQAFGPGMLVQNVDPSSYMSYQSNLNSFNAQNQSQGSIGGQLLGSIAGAGLGALTGGVGTGIAGGLGGLLPGGGGFGAGYRGTF